MIKINRPKCPNPDALKGDYKNPENKSALVEAAFGKCMYCESKISHAQYGDVEHIRPASKFFHLKFEWDNLGYACTICNNNKSDKYDETNAILNPYEDDPAQYIIAMGAFVVSTNVTSRGAITIERKTGVDLNRVALVERRKDAIARIEKIIKLDLHKNNTGVLSMLCDEMRDDKEFSMTIKSLLLQYGIGV